MNHVAKWMMRLYPASWRKRYGDEITRDEVPEIARRDGA